MPDIKQIITNHLTANGFDGLYHPDTYLDCGCLIGDLFPCECDFSKCRPGKKVIGEDGEWRVGPGKVNS